jgi:exodeoxyribonuclease VII small subunit
VADLESEKHSLDYALALFERGQALAQRCTSLLDQAELKVQQVTGDQLTPFQA